MARLQGGTSGILAAIDAGRLDPLSAWLPEEYRLPGLSQKDRRSFMRREARRAKVLARRFPF